MTFRKVLARFYIGWFYDCCDSAVYCKEHNDNKCAEQYLDEASKYLTIIMENWDAIEFFSKQDTAFLYDDVLPKEFRGYL